MKEIAISVSELIEKIKFLKKLRTDKDLATYLEIAPNALNNLKRRNSVGAFLEKLIISTQNKDSNISFDFLLNPATINLFTLDEKYFKAKKISLENSNERELQSILDKFLSEELTLKKIKVKIQRKKNIEFLEKLRELANGDSERMIILFYAILLDLEKNKLLITNDNLNIKFSEIIEKHNFSYFDTLKFGIIFTKKDLSNLKNWIEKELDSVSIIEILSSLPTLKELIKNELGPINKRAISAVEKLFL
ncbi:hypothetical protein AMYT_a0206 (plasmid) [Malaciobacter mytili LMG 24559]|nr:hypothetical protein [Malaciobacter mytili]AXH16504.1 hypothetical protein AMYT_a0206 [Malaciobacter mytili LMG 24559]